MTFTVRVPGHNGPFLKFNASTLETTPIAAGKLVYLVADRTVDVVTTAASQTPVGWLMQKVKAAYTDFPDGYMMRSDLGSTDAFVGDPVGIASGPGAQYETDQYVDEGSDGIAYGTLLYCDNDGKLSDTSADTAAAASAIALNTLTAAQCAAGEMLLIKALV
jgi:hypothetical protein